MPTLLAAFALVASVSAASAQTAQVPQVPEPPPVAAPRQTPIPKTPPAAVTPTPDAELDLPDTDTARRLDRRVGDDRVGGADCRATCDRGYYMCLSNDDSGGCPTSWTKCLTACPAHSSNF